jgi:hypothetical protein
MVRVFRRKFTLEDAIGSHACSLEANIEANMRVTNGIPLGCSLLLPVDAVNCVQTLKAYAAAVKLAPAQGQVRFEYAMAMLRRGAAGDVDVVQSELAEAVRVMPELQPHAEQLLAQISGGGGGAGGGGGGDHGNGQGGGVGRTEL